MRISDWSSDVCSSDLAAQTGGASRQRPSEMRTLFAEDTEAAVVDCVSRLMRLLDRLDAAPVLRPGIMRELHYWLLSDRKSVVEGKSVSVRVDLGGRRIIKKKKTLTKNTKYR